MEYSERPSEYLSKSRLKSWVNCPRKYYYKYVEGIDTPETESMRRGTAVHELIESYYENANKYAENNDELPATLFELLDEEQCEDWREYLNPYLSHFLGFERRRWEMANGNMEDWLPVAIEEEIWREVFDDTPVLMGHADVLLPATSFATEDVPEEHGCVLVDFKTGEPKSDRYRSHENAGVYLDLAYYALLFESDFDIVAVGGYYPKTNTLVTSPISKERQRFVEDVSKDIASANPDDINDFPINEMPLCAWGGGEDERCAFYDECESTWAVPIDNEDETVELIKKGYSDEEIADELGSTEDAVNYWVRKKRWHRYR